jgi:predicted Zn-dependent protease with MMP-like domain
MIRAHDQVAVGLHLHWPAGRGFHAAHGGNAGRTVNDRVDRLARYRAARVRVAPASSIKAFEALVADVLDSLPDYIQQRLENVAVVVEERAAPHQLGDFTQEPGYDLLGLYEGINRVERAGGYHLATPDRITLFRKTILDEVGSADPQALHREVRRTIIHEVAHHFGMDDAELERLGG